MPQQLTSDNKSWFQKIKDFTLAAWFPYTKSSVKYWKDTDSYFKRSALSAAAVLSCPIAWISKPFYALYELGKGIFSKESQQDGDSSQSQEKEDWERYRDFWDATIYDHGSRSGAYFASYESGFKGGIARFLHRLLSLPFSAVNVFIRVLEVPFGLLLGLFGKKPSSSVEQPAQPQHSQSQGADLSQEPGKIKDGKDGKPVQEPAQLLRADLLLLANKALPLMSALLFDQKANETNYEARILERLKWCSSLMSELYSKTCGVDFYKMIEKDKQITEKGKQKIREINDFALDMQANLKNELFLLQCMSRPKDILRQWEDSGRPKILEELGIKSKDDFALKIFDITKSICSAIPVKDATEQEKAQFAADVAAALDSLNQGMPLNFEGSKLKRPAGDVIDYDTFLRILGQYEKAKEVALNSELGLDNLTIIAFSSHPSFTFQHADGDTRLYFRSQILNYLKEKAQESKNTNDSRFFESALEFYKPFLHKIFSNLQSTLKQCQDCIEKKKVKEDMKAQQSMYSSEQPAASSSVSDASATQTTPRQEKLDFVNGKLSSAELALGG